jgi:hypothetical protein
MNVHEFICKDCGTEVVRFGMTHANDDVFSSDAQRDPTRADASAGRRTGICATCSWIRSLPSESDKQKLREFLKLGEPRKET